MKDIIIITSTFSHDVMFAYKLLYEMNMGKYYLHKGIIMENCEWRQN